MFLRRPGKPPNSTGVSRRSVRVEKAEDWMWSSFRHYARGEIGTVEIESF